MTEEICEETTEEDSMGEAVETMGRRSPWPKVTVMVAAVLATALVGGAAGVWAATTFTDVPETHPFAEEITAVADACLAGGFPDGTYRPSQPVTRQAMAAFLARAGSDVAFNQDLSSHIFGSGTLITPAEQAASVVVEVPDIPGCTQWVVLQGQVNLYALSTRAGHCVVIDADQTCRAIVSLDSPSLGNLAASAVSLRDDYPQEIADVFTAVEVGPGVHTFTMSVSGYQLGASAAYYDQARLMATVVPFGHLDPEPVP